MINTSIALTSTASVSIVVVNPAATLPVEEIGGDLIVTGTKDAARIILSSCLGITVRFNSRLYGDLSFSGKIIVHGGEGDDTITLSGSLPFETELYDEATNDDIAGGSGRDFIDDGVAIDYLYGGNSPTVLVWKGPSPTRVETPPAANSATTGFYCSLAKVPKTPRPAISSRAYSSCCGWLFVGVF